MDLGREGRGTEQVPAGSDRYQPRQVGLVMPRRRPISSTQMLGACLGNSPWKHALMGTSKKVSLLAERGFPCGSAGKESACNVGDLGLIPGLGRSPGEGKGYPLLYSGLENSMDCIVHGVAKRVGPRILCLPCTKPPSWRSKGQPWAIHPCPPSAETLIFIFTFISTHKARGQAGHSQDTGPLSAPASRAGLSQVVEQPAREGNGLPLMFLVQLPEVSLLPAPELHQGLVASELVQRGWGHLCGQQRRGGLGQTTPAGAQFLPEGALPPGQAHPLPERMLAMRSSR